MVKRVIPNESRMYINYIIMSIKKEINVTTDTFEHKLAYFDIVLFMD